METLDILRNTDLENKFTDFIESSLKLLGKKFGRSLPFNEISVPERLEDHALTYKMEKVLDFSWYLYESAEAFGNLIETQKLIDELMNNEITSKWVGKPKNFDVEPLSKKENYTWIFKKHLSKALNRYLKEAKSYKFKKNVSKKVYREFGEFLSRDYENFTIFAPITGFNSDIDEIKLDENLVIRRITDEEYKRVHREGESRLMPMSIWDTHYIDFVITYKYTRNVGEPHDTSSSKKLFENVIAALRLFKKGNVGFNYFYSTPDHWLSPFGLISGGDLDYKHYGGSEYKLEESEVRDFINFWRDFTSLRLEQYRFLALAINRFNLSQERLYRPQDKLIDLMIALESLYLRDKRELSFKLSTRAGRILKEDPEERKETAEFIKKAYNMRSSAVHGSEVEKEITINDTKLNINQVIDKLEDIVRSSIRLFMKLSKENTKEEIDIFIKDVMFNRPFA